MTALGQLRILVLALGHQRLERNQVVVAEHLDFLPRLPRCDVLHAQRMYEKRLGDHVDVVLGGIADVQPPDGPGAFGLVQPVREVSREIVVPGG